MNSTVAFKPPVGSGADGSTASGPAVTSSENLVLGLFGFLSPPQPNASPAVNNVTWTDPNKTFVSPYPAVPPPIHDVVSLNPLRPVTFHYLDYVADELSKGAAGGLEYTAGSGTNTDTFVPEFIDRFNVHLPILYMRANVGNTVQAGTTDFKTQANQYNYGELLPYGSWMRSSDGTKTWQQFDSKSIQNLYSLSTQTSPAPTLDDTEASPYNDFWNAGPAPGTNYYLNVGNNMSNSIRGKDGFILMSAGKDHTYGTQDDIIVTP